MRILAISLFFVSSIWGDFVYFTPPPDWNLGDPKNYSSHVQIQLIAPSSRELPPSINLAIEPVSISLVEYVRAVKKIHEADPNNELWRNLGSFQTQAGTAQLTEIEAKTERGKVRLFQLLLLHKGFAYVLTASALKEEFPKFYTLFEKVFRSLTAHQNLLDGIAEEKRKKILKEKIENLKITALEEGTAFQAFLLKEYADMGPHWQMLLLREILQKKSL